MGVGVGVAATLGLAATPVHAERFCWPWQKPVKAVVHRASPAPQPERRSLVRVHRYRLSSPISPILWRCSTFDPPDAYITVISIDPPVTQLQPMMLLDTPAAVRQAPGAPPADAFVRPPIAPARPPIPIVHPVPEPSTWALLLVGFLGVGVALRRARRPGQAAEGTPARSWRRHGGARFW